MRFHKRVSPGKAEHVISTNPTEGTTFIYKDFSMTVTFGKHMQELYNKALSANAGLSGLEKEIAVMDLVRDAFKKSRRERNKTLDDALKKNRGACLEESIAGCLLLDRREDGTLKKEYSVVYGELGAISKSKFLKRYRMTTTAHAWVEGGGLILDFGMDVIGIPVSCPSGSLMVLSDETIPKALECHLKILRLFEDEMKKDSVAWMKVKRGLEEARKFREVHDCHLRIRDSFIKIINNMSREKKENSLMPFVYHRKAQKIAVKN
jgi:hypothetical protein